MKKNENLKGQLFHQSKKTLSSRAAYQKDAIQDRTYGKKNSSHKGLNEGWTRATFIMQEDFLEKIKEIAYWERKTVKSVVNQAFKEFFKKHKVA